MNNSAGNFTIEPLQVLRLEPPVYFATVNGRLLKLSLRELVKWRKFKTACIAQLEFLPVLPVIVDEAGRAREGDQAIWETRFLAPALGSAEAISTFPEGRW